VLEQQLLPAIRDSRLQLRPQMVPCRIQSGIWSGEEWNGAGAWDGDGDGDEGGGTEQTLARRSQ